tara:strand:- start:3344 stop:4513 length:1170 start_codon:yes stop_codon:yes gene_type:complete
MVKKIYYGKQFIEEKDLKLLVKSAKQNLITTGPMVKLFEKKISKYLNVKYTTVCNSGTAAMHLALMSIDLKKDDVIIMPSVNFISAFNMANLFKAKIYLADVDKTTGQMTSKNVDSCIKKNKLKNIKLIITMFLGGYPENIANFYNLKKKYKCFIIEDACHAFGASYKSKSLYFKVGSCKHADISTFSFHPLKSITTGEGGAITTNNSLLSKKILLGRSHGIIRGKNHWEYDIKKYGMNYRISDINCALGISQLKKIKSFLAKRKIISENYKKLISDPILREHISVPVYDKKNKPSYHLFIALINFKKLKCNKDYLFNFFKKRQIYLQYHYIPLYKFSIYKDKKLENFQNTENYYENAISLPIYYDLSFKQQWFVVKILKEFIQKYKIK